MQGIRIGIITISEIVAIPNYLWNHCTGFIPRRREWQCMGRLGKRRWVRCIGNSAVLQEGKLANGVGLQRCEHETKRRSLKITLC